MARTSTAHVLAALVVTLDSLLRYLTNRNVIGGGMPTLTGPSSVDESNIEYVVDLAEAATR